MDGRIIVSMLVAITLVGVVLVAIDVNDDAEAALVVPAKSTPFVTVDGPDGSIWYGSVIAEPGTAFHALMAAAAVGGFTVTWSGTDGARYVSAINGHDDTGGGWCVQVDGEDSPLSVDRFPAGDGQEVRWYWTDGQCEKF